jgi:hypothetical protein
MVTADQFEGMSVGIAEVETLVVFSSVDTAFNGNAVLGEVHLPLADLCRLDRELFDHLKPEIIVAGTFDELLQIAFGRTGEGPIGSLL